MWINCKLLWENGVKPGCCNSCHDDADYGFDNMLELYADTDAGIECNRDCIGTVCCKVDIALDKMDVEEKKVLLKKLHQQEEVFSNDL